jgi:hypothetical protein
MVLSLKKNTRRLQMLMDMRCFLTLVMFKRLTVIAVGPIPEEPIVIEGTIELMIVVTIEVTGAIAELTIETLVGTTRREGVIGTTAAPVPVQDNLKLKSLKFGTAQGYRGHAREGKG